MKPMDTSPEERIDKLFQEVDETSVEYLSPHGCEDTARRLVTHLAYVDSQREMYESMRKRLRDLLFSVVNVHGSSAIELPGLGVKVKNIYPRPRKQWTYPEELQEMERALQAEKKYAEIKGTATYTEKPSTAYVKVERLKS